MRRWICAILLVCSLASFFTGCGNESSAQKHSWERIENLNEYTAVEKCTICGITRKYTDADHILSSDSALGVKILRYNWDGYGVGYKELYDCDLGYAIIDCISKLQETGERIAHISDEEVNEYSGQLPVEPGTVWVDCGSIGLFRVSAEMKEICQVQTHLGMGKALQMTDTLKELLKQALYYYPSDYWTGTYENGTVTLQQEYKNTSAVEWVVIESIHIENKIDARNNKIKLRIGAKESKTVEAFFMSYQSDDNFGSSDAKTVELISGEETTVEATFYGFTCSYMLSITIDNTRIILTIKQ